MRDISGYEGLYKMDQDGRVWNKKGKELKPTTRGNKKVFQLCKDGVYKTWTSDQLTNANYNYKKGSKEQIMIGLGRVALHPYMKEHEFVEHMTNVWYKMIVEAKKEGPTEKG